MKYFKSFFFVHKYTDFIHETLQRKNVKLQTKIHTESFSTHAWSKKCLYMLLFFRLNLILILFNEKYFNRRNRWCNMQSVSLYLFSAANCTNSLVQFLQFQIFLLISFINILIIRKVVFLQQQQQQQRQHAITTTTKKMFHIINLQNRNKRIRLIPHLILFPKLNRGLVVCILYVTVAKISPHKKMF